MIPRLFRYLSRNLPNPSHRVIFAILYVTAHTVGVGKTATIVYRSFKEIKALNLQKKVAK